MKKKFDNSKRWQNLLRTVLLAPFCLVFPGVAASVNPLTTVTETPSPSGNMSEGGGAEPTSTEGQTAPPEGTEPTETPINTPSGSTTPQPAEILQKLGLDKFKDVEALGNSYKSIEQMHSKTANENAQLKAQRAQLETQLENMRLEAEARQQTAPPIAEPQALSPEDIEEENLRLAEQIMNDPRAFSAKLREEAKNEAMAAYMKEIEGIKKQVAPIIEQNQRAEQQTAWNNRASEFAQAVDPSGNLIHPEVSRVEVREAMVEAFNKFPGLVQAEDGFDTAYRYALGELKTTGHAPAIDPGKLLEDESFLKQAAANPKIMEMATKQYLESIKNGSPPPVMGASTGGSPSAIPENKPKTVAEGSNQLRRFLGL